jgi:hypothetical protein
VALPTSEDLYGVLALSPTAVWIVGDGNTVLRFDGVSWTPLASDATQSTSLRGAWGASPSEVWAVGSGGTVLRCSGGTASKQSSGTGYLLNAVWGSAANDLWAVGSLGALVHYDGASWSTVSSGTGSSLYAIHGSSASEVRAVGANGTAIRLSAGVWKTESIPETIAGLHAIAASGPGNVLVGGTSGTLRRFDGASWSKLATRASSSLTAVWSGAGETWAVGKSGLVLRSGPGGWQMIEPPAPSADLNAVWGLSASEIWVAGATGLVARHGNGVWSKASTGTVSSLNGLWGRSSSDLWAVGSYGAILHFNGTGWATLPPLHGATLHAVHGTASHLFAGGGSSRVIEFDGQWSITDLQESTTYRAVWAHGAGSVWLVGDGGARAYYDGIDWKVSSGGTNLLGLFGLSPTQLWAVGEGGVILTIAAGLGTTTQDSDTTSNLTAIHGSSATDLWAVGASGTILHHDDRLP